MLSQKPAFKAGIVISAGVSWGILSHHRLFLTLHVWEQRCSHATAHVQRSEQNLCCLTTCLRNCVCWLWVGQQLPLEHLGFSCLCFPSYCGRTGISDVCYRGQFPGSSCLSSLHTEPSSRLSKFQWKFKLFIIFIYWICVYIYHSACVAVTGQFKQVDFLLPKCGSRYMWTTCDSGHQTW